MVDTFVSALSGRASLWRRLAICSTVELAFVSSLGLGSGSGAWTQSGWSPWCRRWSVLALLSLAPGSVFMPVCGGCSSRRNVRWQWCTFASLSSSFPSTSTPFGASLRWGWTLVCCCMKMWSSTRIEWWWITTRRRAWSLWFKLQARERWLVISHAEECCPRPARG